jgi:hypothetical protein
MNKFALLCLLSLGACKKGDDCEQVFTKMASTMKEMSGMKDKFVDECRKNHDKFVKDPMMKCVLDASGDSAVADCMKKSFEDYGAKSKKTEAMLQLNKLAKDAKVAAVTNNAFPTGKAKTLPAGNGGTETCCGGDKGKCAVSAEWAADPVWKALEFSIDEPTLYRYTYESKDGKSFTATAVGDLDCDGKTATYTMTGTIDASGNPSTNLTTPGPGEN